MVNSVDQSIIPVLILDLGLIRSPEGSKDKERKPV